MLDLVLCGWKSDMVKVNGDVEPLVPPDAYHPPLVVDLTLPQNNLSLPAGVVHPPLPPRPYAFPNWNFCKADILSLYEAMSEIDWTCVTSESDVELAVGKFYLEINNCINIFVPVKQCNSHKRYVYPSWYTAQIIDKIQTKYFHLKRYRQQGKEFNLEVFKYYRELVKTMIDEAYQQHIRQTEDNIQKDPRQFWKFMKERKKSRQGICDTYEYEGKTVTGQDAVDAFAKYFSSVFHSSPPRLDPKEAAQITSDTGDSARVSVNSVDKSDLREALKKLKPHSSPGPDALPPFLVKDCIGVLEKPLLHLYNLALKNAVYPSIWKTSKVTPVPKITSACDVINFRPIAVLSVFGKIFEAMLDQKIRQQIDSQLSECQHGFRSGRSTTTNLIELVDYVAGELDTSRQVDAAYFDFKKAFDLVDNDILLRKMSALGFTPNLLKFFANYLRGRQQYVKLGNYESSVYETLSGVSQGSTLGPTQFLIMINDLPNVLKTTRYSLFADDLKLVTSIRYAADAVNMQSDIDAVLDWSLSNRLEFNTVKCKQITFTRSRSALETNYTLEGVPLEKVNEIRDLGIVLDSKLDFHAHVKATCKSANKLLGFIMRTCYRFSGTKVAITLYNAYVRSRLEYAAAVWDPHENKYKLMIEKVQRKFARYLYKRQYGLYPFLYPSLFVSGAVGLYTLEFRRKMRLMAHYWQVLHSKVNSPSSLASIAVAVPPFIRYDYKARRPHRLLALPVARTRGGYNAPTARARTLLGDMLVAIHDADVFHDSQSSFMTKIELYLNQRYCDILCI